MSIRSIKVAAIILLLFTTSKLIAQKYPSENDWHLFHPKNNSTYRIDTILGDTLVLFHSDLRFYVKSKDNVYLTEGNMLGGMSSLCGCEVRPHGFWIQRYRTGRTKSTGTYYCGKKINSWLYYYPNGKIKRVEHLTWSYPKPFLIDTAFYGALKSKILRNGPYQEYYKNGQLKINGNYNIVEVYSTIDSTYSVDPETYELLINTIPGEFWLPVSRKYGRWVEYLKNGQIKKQYNYPLYHHTSDSIRNIEHRYFENLLKLNAVKQKD